MTKMIKIVRAHDTVEKKIMNTEATNMKLPIYVIELVRETNNIKPNTKSYAVIHNGENYTVCIDKKPKCECYDYVIKKKRCKHIYYVLMRVLFSKDPNKEIFEEKDLRDMFNAKRREFTKQNVKEGYYRFKPKNNNNAKDVKDDLCPICLDNLVCENGEKQQELETCVICHNKVHKECLVYYNTKMKKDKCIYCNKNKKDGRVKLLL